MAESESLTGPTGKLEVIRAPTTTHRTVTFDLAAILPDRQQEQCSSTFKSVWPICPIVQCNGQQPLMLVNDIDCAPPPRRLSNESPSRISSPSFLPSILVRQDLDETFNDPPSTELDDQCYIVARRSDKPSTLTEVQVIRLLQRISRPSLTCGESYPVSAHFDNV